MPFGATAGGTPGTASWDPESAPRDGQDDVVGAERSEGTQDERGERVEHQKGSQQLSASDTSEHLIDPALRSGTPTDKKPTYDPREDRTHSPASFIFDSQRRGHFDDTHRVPSPAGGQPQVPHSHSPSPSIASVDRSSISTPPIRRSPPSAAAGANGGGPGASHLFQNSYHHDPSLIQSGPGGPRHHDPQQPNGSSTPTPSGPGTATTPAPAQQQQQQQPAQHHQQVHHQPGAHQHQQYIYAPPPPPPFDHRYDHSPHSHPGAIHSPYTATGIPPGHFAVPPPMAHHPPPGPHSYGHPYGAPHQGSMGPGQVGVGQQVQIVHTDDAATKLSDRVRRRCLQLLRSNLSPGKVLCNKCGLFERTHSRPRPEQFPHKRGPLATTSLQQRRTPPGGGHHQFAPPPPPPHLQPIHGQGGPPTHLPPLSGPPGQSPYQYNPPPPGSSQDRGPHSVVGGPPPPGAYTYPGPGGWGHPGHQQPPPPPPPQQHDAQGPAMNRRDSHSSANGQNGNGHENGSGEGHGSRVPSPAGRENRD
ncbi:hypothetical protein BKA70DRAFT_1325823 [Coprinopsis sp. MPI-PUGE-AT-0042]|nr:hypothetical protein BKA70DRAFT_1325823 [Coprinopsis sp. MPI-PUGE-AT-0042]